MARTRTMSGFRLRGEVGGVPASFALADGDNLVGSRAGADLQFVERGVSRRHAVVRVLAGQIEVEDLQSKNGTFLNGKRVDRTEMAPGDEVRFGSVALRLEATEVGDDALALAFATGGHAPAADASTRSSLRVDCAAPIWLTALEAAARRIESENGHSGAALRAFASAAGLSACQLEWDGCGEPRVLAACGDPALLGAVRELRQVFASCAGQGRAESLMVNQTPAFGAAAVPGDPRPTGVAVLGVDLQEGCEAALRTLAWMLRTSPTPGSEPAEAELPGLLFPSSHVPGRSPAMLALYRQLRPLVQGDIPVLIVGETGVGKEHVARILHGSSPRAGGPFVALNCAAIPAELLEAELFGIERGVATGVAEREGRFQLAQGGVLLLDEIGDMAPALQAKLLRVLQEREVFPVGARRPIAVDVGVIAATNLPPERLLAEGRIRPDLYYRIAGYVLRVPPLRERRADIPVLVEHFVSRFARDIGKSVRGVTVRALERLVTGPWPGNVRELEHEVRRLVFQCPHGQAIDSTLIAEPSPQAVETDDLNLERQVVALERALVRAALDRAGGNRTQAAALLGVSRNGLALKIERLGIAVPGPVDPPD